MDQVRTVHLRVEGRVQGVGFRAWTESTARSLRLTGWVRNRPDASVEMVLHGPAVKISEMLHLCERGPLHARVTKVEILGEGAGAYRDFVVLPSE